MSGNMPVDDNNTTRRKLPEPESWDSIITQFASKASDRKAQKGVQC
jgi:hypothetical protein